ncbi:MAG: hypothetical protein ACTSXN_13735 [Promethearchaeota archaeon]
MQMKEMANEDFNGYYQLLKKALDKQPFIIIIGKYDHILGPRALYSSVNLKDEGFVRNLLRDALNTKNEFLILDFNQFYSQIYKIDVVDENARGKKQLYAIILLRDVAYPLIPMLHFKRIGMIFRKIATEEILNNNITAFENFFKEVSDIYMKKGEVLPLESTNLQIRSGINTIQGFCELTLEQIKKDDNISKEDIESYIELMLDSCDDITEALEKPFSSACK